MDVPLVCGRFPAVAYLVMLRHTGQAGGGKPGGAAFDLVATARPEGLVALSRNSFYSRDRRGIEHHDPRLPDYADRPAVAFSRIRDKPLFCFPHGRFLFGGFVVGTCEAQCLLAREYAGGGRGVSAAVRAGCVVGDAGADCDYRTFVRQRILDFVLIRLATPAGAGQRTLGIDDYGSFRRCPCLAGAGLSFRFIWRDGGDGVAPFLPALSGITFFLDRERGKS